ncbi:Serine hydrolase FSH [Metarhizium rileyi]|uniref:Serine hydrolase FSH n=1 Tax=Metarhizium rileyi (strain RCEF 4871) TaxID=1649241 RepID=A0A166S8J8_METRR|nr:Serine hydrolase FSH [Metarhizium rileyi RCEF 4871]TWU77397.1 hypothetical protein ED733_006232 [Metarhizium rileyi]
MRFLCLHGYATSSDVLREMMEPIIEHLPSNWEYEYLEAGMEPSKLVLPNLDQVPTPNYSWYNYAHPEDVRDALDRLLSFIESEGPFDGLWGFSQGAALATLLLLEHQRENPGSHDWPFKMIIYNSTFLPYRLDSGSVTWEKTDTDQLQATYQPGDVDALLGEKDVDWKQDERTVLDYRVLRRVKDVGPFPAQLLLRCRPQDLPYKLDVPSVHVRGVKDEYAFVDDSVFELFNPTTAKKMTHRGGHHFPRFPDELVHFAELIIETAASIV